MRKNKEVKQETKMVKTMDRRITDYEWEFSQSEYQIPKDMKFKASFSDGKLDYIHIHKLDLQLGNNVVYIANQGMFRAVYKIMTDINNIIQKEEE